MYTYLYMYMYVVTILRTRYMYDSHSKTNFYIIQNAAYLERNLAPVTLPLSGWRQWWRWWCIAGYSWTLALGPVGVWGSEHTVVWHRVCEVSTYSMELQLVVPFMFLLINTQEIWHTLNTCMIIYNQIRWARASYRLITNSCFSWLARYVHCTCINMIISSNMSNSTYA